MNKRCQGLIVCAAVGTSALLVQMLGCSGELDYRTVSRDDPDYSNLVPGYNYRDGKTIYCEYLDPTVLRTIAGGSAASGVRAPSVVEPGLHDTSRAEVLAGVKQQAIDYLRGAGRPGITQIGSCDLRCKEVTYEEHSASSDASSAYGQGSGASGKGSGASGASSGSGGVGASDTANQASTTNNQVPNVDEADFIKNDNKYMYVVANGRVKIIEAWPAATARTLATLSVPVGTPTNLFANDTRLVVYSAVAPSGSRNGFGTSAQACSYGFDCVPTGDGSATHVSIFDTTDKSAPRLVRELDFSGSLIAARKIGNAIHSVVYDPPLSERVWQLASPPVLPERCFDRRDNIDQVAADFGRKVDEKVQRIEALSENGPTLVDGRAPVEPSFLASNVRGETFLSLVSFGLDEPGVKAATLVSRPGFVYASSNALYVSVPHVASPSEDWYSGIYARESSTSEVYKFALGASPSQTRYEASGIVKGTVLNQFAMDEWGGNLRMATTSGHAPDPNAHSTVTVFAQNGGNLDRAGMVDHIAPSEDIRSVRFDGDRGFVVTFKKTDPLFAIDLATPTAPRLTGELKIPGFSTYMHFMDRTHILAIGLEADDQGSFAFFNGIQLQIFDVADMRNPRLLHKSVIGTRGTTSEALTNHLGFNYFAPKNLLALPMTICDGGGNGTYGQNLSFNGLLVYDASVAGGLVKRGGIPHAIPQNVTCYNWWTEANSTVKRSVIMDDYVYSVAEDVVKVSNLGNLANPVSSISLK